MKKFFFILVITMASFYSLNAAQVNETKARQVAEAFFSAKSSRFTAPASQLQLAYTAERDHFYIFDRGMNRGFVVVAGDDRLPQVLGYSETGHFSVTSLPPAMQYWMHEMNRQIEYLLTHEDAVIHQPAKRETAVEPLMTTRWSQDSPYNNLCPTYTDNKGNTFRSVTGCVATATAQVMNYHQWPPVGRGSHSYMCNVNDMTPTELSADFSQSVYQWDLMLDSYNDSSSVECCEAVAKLMSDVGISMDMGYGSSSGAYEWTAMQALKRYFKYSDRCYLLNRDNYNAAEWDQFLVDEISARRPIIYCGYSLSGMEGGGHAFVLDGFNTDGYFHVNWGWGGSSDGYFLVSFLSPSSGLNFEFMQDGIFGLVPEPQAETVEDVLHIRSLLKPMTSSVQLGTTASFMMDDFMAEGNALDTAGYDEYGNRKHYYALIPISLGVFDKDGVERQHTRLDYKYSLDERSWGSGQSIDLRLLNSLEEGEYVIKLAYSLDDGENYDNKVLDFSGKEVYVKMTISDNMAYLTDCFLANTYSLDSFVLPRSIMVNEQFSVDVYMTYRTWGGQEGPVGNVYLSILNEDGNEVSSSDLCQVQIASNSVNMYQMQITAPAQWGNYDLVLKDESGNELMMMKDWFESEPGKVHIFVLPICQELVEDFESMTANSSTSDKNVQGNFTTWSFTKCGVRSPGEDRCNGANSVMMKKPSALYTTQPLQHNYLLAQATFFNSSSSAAKYTLEYSYDGGSTWQRAQTIDHLDAVEVPEKSQTVARWMLNLSGVKPVNFRIAMTGGTTAATYFDDFVLYYYDNLGDVNLDGEVNIADVNAVIAVILGDSGMLQPSADVNADSEVNIADINAVIDLVIGR